LHGDLHIGNIITDGRRDLWIDVGDFAWGAAEWDLGMLYYTTHFLSPERVQGIFHLDTDTFRRHWDYFAPAYYGTDDPEKLSAIERSLHPYIASKLAYIIGKLGYGAKGVSEGMMRLFSSFLGI
jgi:hypothetical protein